MSQSFERDIADLFEDRLARISVPPRRTGRRHRSHGRALAAATAVGLLLGSAATVLQANADAESQGVGCADIVTKLKLHVGIAVVANSRPGNLVAFPNGSASGTLPQSSDPGTPIATCSVDGTTFQVFDRGTSWAIQRLVPGQ